jgi:DNA-binding response OmpR family regulator
MRILVLEDEDSIRRMISALVSARGYDVIAAGNGVKAVDESFKTPPDAALLDLMVPGSFDGFEVLRRLRAEPATANIPIFVISAMDSPESKAKAMELGATKFFVKPFSAMQLLKELEVLKGLKK